MRMNGSYRAILFVLPLILLIIPQIYLFDHVSDDSYISFRYAQRLMEGRGLTFNDGEFVEGFSNPLWVLILSASGLLTNIELSLLARVIAFVLSYLTLIGVWRLCCLVKDPRQRLLSFLVALVLITATPGFHVYATAGLEGPLLGFLLICGITIHISTSTPLERNVAAPLIMGLAGITRPEAPLYGLLWLLFVAVFEKELELRRRVPFVRFSRAFLARGILLALPIVAYEVFRVYYFDAWVPNTALAKPPGTFGAYWGFGYLIPWVATVSPLLLFTLVISRQRGSFPNPARLVAVHASGPILGMLVFVFYAHGDWMAFGRFVTPVWPMAAALFAIPIGCYLGERHSAHVYPRDFLVNASVLVLLGLTTLLPWSYAARDYLRGNRLWFVMRGHDQVTVGKWIHENFKEPTTIAVGRLGAISYFARQHTVWDRLGLTDREVAEYRRSGARRGFRGNPAHARKPEILILGAPEDGGCLGSYPAEEQQFLEEFRYECIKEFPQGNDRPILIWHRRDGAS